MSNRIIFYVERMVRRDRHGNRYFRREDGWNTREEAERAAAFYRREYRRPTRIVESREN